jgi:hypothetical protein
VNTSNPAWATLLLGEAIREAGTETGGFSNLRQNLVMRSAELRPENDSVGGAQQELQITDPTCRQKGFFIIRNPQISKHNLRKKKRKNCSRPQVVA